MTLSWKVPPAAVRWPPACRWAGPEWDCAFVSLSLFYLLRRAAASVSCAAAGIRGWWQRAVFGKLYRTL